MIKRFFNDMMDIAKDKTQDHTIRVKAIESMTVILTNDEFVEKLKTTMPNSGIALVGKAVRDIEAKQNSPPKSPVSKPKPKPKPRPIEPGKMSLLDELKFKISSRDRKGSIEALEELP